MDIFNLLKQDHENVATIFKKIETLETEASAQTREQLFAELKTELDLHAEIEESIVYPAFRDKPGLEEIIEESLEEHQEIQDLLSDLEGLGADDSDWKANLDGLQERVEHHVQEEEGDMFQKARAAMASGEAEALGKKAEDAMRHERGQRSGYKKVG
jgi:iron-sulfur cluster repair protein YtfE (RIC family)